MKTRKEPMFERDYITSRTVVATQRGIPENRQPKERLKLYRLDSKCECAQAPEAIVQGCCVFYGVAEDGARFLWSHYFQYWREAQVKKYEEENGDEKNE
tara:strand:- start:31 stop:327 length:297 start_codon:yes stop_codon:yes gene_type:complete